MLIAALFVVGEGLVRTGVARMIGDWLAKKAGSNDLLLLVLLMLSVAGLGSMMSGTAVVAIFIPVVLRICQNAGTAPSQLMMPLSFAALISGMLTLVATAPNLVINAEMVRQGIEGFGFFGITPFGIPILLLGIAYMFVARRWLSSEVDAAVAEHRQPSMVEWVTQYGLDERAYRVRITLGSSLVGQRLSDLSLRKEGVNLLAIERSEGFKNQVIRPDSRTILEAGDILLVDVVATGTDRQALRQTYGLEAMALGSGAYFTDRTQDIGMVEVIIPPESPLIGRSVLEARIRDERRLTVIGLRHGRNVVRDGLLKERLKVGGTLLLVGFWSDIRKLNAQNAGMVVLNLPADLDDVLPIAGRAPHALAALVVTVGLMISGIVPNVQAALIGCLLMGLFGCIDLNTAYRSISWKTIILIVGMLPFSIALQRTGGVDLASEALLAAVGGASPRIVLGALFLITAMLGLFISNTATAVLMAPVALALASGLGASPYPFAMTVALAASTAFMTPISTPLNTLVMGPGNYAFGDFVKIGVPFSLIVMAVSVLLVPVLLPL